jgi:hypothetical protein
VNHRSKRAVVWSSLLSAAVLLAPTAGLAGPTGTVLSNNVKDADGTTAQDTTKGSGIKTNHLQNLAVTSAKLADGAVTTAKITAGAVGTTALGAAAVGTPNIANGAVTDAKIAGPIAASKIATGFFQQKYGRLVVVATSGGDFTNPADALASVTDASATYPALVKIMPGVYDIGSRLLQLKSYVDVEGSGEGVTVVKGVGAVVSANIGVLVAGADNSEVRALTLQATQSAADTSRMYLYVLQGGARLRDVTVTGTSDGGYYLAGADLVSSVLALDRVKVQLSGAQNVIGVQLRGVTETLRDVDVQVTALSYGVGLDGLQGATLDVVGSSFVVSSAGYPTRAFITSVADTRISASRLIATGSGQGLAASSAVVHLDGSLVSGTQYAFLNQGAEVDVAYSRLGGPPFTDPGYGGTTRCLGTYNDSLQPVTCQ